MKAAPSSCRVSTKRMSLRPYISVMIELVVVPTTPKVYSTPSARSASRTAWPAFIDVSLLGPSAAEALPEELVHGGAAELGALDDRVADAREHLLEARTDLPLPDLPGALIDPPGRLVDLRLVGSAGRAGNQGHGGKTCDKNPCPARASSHNAPPSVRLAHALTLPSPRTRGHQGITRCGQVLRAVGRLLHLEDCIDVLARREPRSHRVDRQMGGAEVLPFTRAARPLGGLADGGVV